MSIHTLWKVSFAYNLWRVSGLFQRLPETKGGIDQVAQNPWQLLRVMTAVWGQSAIGVTLVSAISVLVTWQDKVPNVPQALLALVLVGATAAIYSNSNETKELASAVPVAVAAIRRTMHQVNGCCSNALW